MTTDLLAKLRIVSVIITFNAFFQIGNAAEVTIANAKRNIPLTDTELTYKDYYMTVDASLGVQRNVILNVYRKQLLSDATGTQSLGELKILVGQLKVIALDRNIAVAREVKLISRENEPMLEQTGIMIGDLVEVAAKPSRQK